jgi:hypothetical protein
MSKKYVVIKNGRGKYCPRIKFGFGLNWFEEPYEYDTFEEAKLALQKKKKADEDKAKAYEYEIVFELE